MNSGLIPRGATAKAMVASAKRGQRLRSLLIGLLVSVLVAAGAKFGITVVSNAAGLRAIDRYDYAGAQSLFENNLALNWFDPWLAHYNTGVALYLQENWSGAEERFSTALPLAPDEKKCQVALNLSWSYESDGDSLNKRGDVARASQAWAQAKSIAEDSGCSDGEDEDKSQAQQDTENRLQEKMDAASAESDEDQDDESEAQDDKQDQLDQDNQQAQQEEQDQRDQMSQDSSGSSDEKNW